MKIAGFYACVDCVSNYFKIQILHWKLRIIYTGEKLDFKMQGSPVKRWLSKT